MLMDAARCTMLIRSKENTKQHNVAHCVGDEVVKVY